MKNKASNKSPYQKYAQVSALVIEMGVIIGLFVYGGTFIDKKTGFEMPLFTIVLSLLGVGIAMYLLIRQINNK